jgi:3D (Asp-Asp-Asp) domain-containing protein
MKHIALVAAVCLTIQVTATEYCLRGETRTGTQARPGVVAVDPRVIPLGSRVYVPTMGWFRAADTGRLIKGRRIDLWTPSRSGARRFGRQRMMVKVRSGR